MSSALVTAGNLGADFDMGSRISQKINLSWAISPTWTGTHAFSLTPTHLTPATSDASTKSATTAFVANLLSNSASLGALIATLPTTPPATAEQAWLDNGVLRVS